MKQDGHTPDIEARFLQPPGWEWGEFERIPGRRIRFGHVAPADSPPKAVVVCLNGLSEFCEKYYETAHSMLKRGYAFWTMDWMGQGLSDRYLKENPHKRHSSGFDEDIEDFSYFIQNHILPYDGAYKAADHKLALLAHSMGGNLAFRYLQTHTDVFSCAAFTAPMFGLGPFTYIPYPVSYGLTWLLNKFFPTSYVIGEADWRAELRPNPGNDNFSTDPVRGAVHNAWCLADPRLQVGRITYGWLHNANISGRKSVQKSAVQNVSIPLLFGVSGRESFVNNRAILQVDKWLSNAKCLEFPEARHEIFMERDEIRSLFMEGVHQMIQAEIQT